MTIHNFSDDFEGGRQYVEALLRRHHIADGVTVEATLLFETLCQSILSQHPDADISVTGRAFMGYVTIRLSFEGGMYVPESDETLSSSPEGRILAAYADKIGYSYRSGYNRIQINVRRGSLAALLPRAAALLLAIVVYLPLRYLAGPETRQLLLDGFAVPLERIFINAVLLVAGPVTFLSFIKHMTGIYIVGERLSDARRLRNATFVSSIVSVLLAIVTGLAIVWLPGNQELRFAYSPPIQVAWALSTWFSTLVPSDILAPFLEDSPFPLLFVSLLFTYAFCSAGKYFDRMKAVVDALFDIFSRLLSVVMYALPFFVFTAVLDVLLSNGFIILRYIGVLILFVALGLFVPLGYYMLRLLRKRIPLGPFLRELPPLLRENWQIGSAIDAAPFNIRYCARHYGMDRRRLETALPILAQLNLDGNCFFITLITLVVMLGSSAEISLLSLFGVAALVFFLSLGAPNQPGSTLIGITVLMNYTQSGDSMIALAILCEMLFGGLLNLTNVLGDIVTVAQMQGIHASPAGQPDSGEP